MTRYFIGVDPSGNFNEGKGCTGIAVYDKTEDKFVLVTEEKASKYKTQYDYWFHIMTKIFDFVSTYRTSCVSIEDYILYAHKMKSQTNSNLETPQLIGALKFSLEYRNIPFRLRPAVRVKPRWTDEILVKKGYLTQRGKVYLCGNVVTNDHMRDAMRHALHCAIFEYKEESNE